ncbi:DMT family transporter [Streptomyces sp. NPDC093970]|uniref:DMT family transporter n=1 Tax=Streptomyces sp. NPDC093970 TaxID=3155076 RepID=UPI00341FE209
MSSLALSVVLSFVSAVAYAGGAIVQEQVAVSSPDEQYAPVRRPSWWGAMALNGLGGLLHVVALAYGPLSLVQPLGALTIVFALPMAALLVGRRAGSTAWRGAIMATVGLAGLLSLVGTSDSHSLDAAGRTGVAVVTGGAIVALMAAGRAAHRHPAVRSVLLAVASGIAFGMSSVFTKVVAIDWDGGIAVSDLLWLAVIGVYAVAGVMISQTAYRGGGLAAPLATLTVVNPVLAAAVGITMFDESFRYGTTGTLLALACGVVAMGGLILLTTERIESTPHPVGTAPEPETSPEPLLEALVELAEAGLAGARTTKDAVEARTAADAVGARATVADLVDAHATEAAPARAGLAAAGPSETALSVDAALATAGPSETALSVDAALSVAGPSETALAVDAALAVAGPPETALAMAGPSETALAMDTALTVDAGLPPLAAFAMDSAFAGLSAGGAHYVGPDGVGPDEVGPDAVGIRVPDDDGGVGSGGPAAEADALPALPEMPRQRTSSVPDVVLPAVGHVPALAVDRRRTRVRF